jgi:hypothetical protein
MSLNDLSLSLGRRHIAGPDLNTAANATSLTNEADATTSWTSSGLDGVGANVFESQGVIKQNGDYALHSDANDTPTVSAGFSIDLDGAPYSLTIGQEYRITCYSRHIGSGGKWGIFIASNSILTADATTVASILTTDLTFIAITHDFTHSANTRYFGGKEFSGSNNGGIYFDTLSIRLIG